jgi:hypothetical protein
MVFHGLLLAGLLLAWRWELIGGLTVVAAAAIFFRGALGPRFWLFFVLTAIPGFLWILLAIERSYTTTGVGREGKP